MTEWRKRDPDKTRERRYFENIKRYYGLSREGYLELLIHQDGKCALCREEAERLNVDHDHRTGHVRGLLCNRCNTGLSLLDDPERLNAAVAYLQINPRYLEVLTA